VSILSKVSQLKDYNSDLLALFLSVSYRSSMAYLTGLTLYTVIFVAYIPLTIFYSIVVAHLIYQVIRFYFIYKYKKMSFSAQSKENFLKQHTLLMLFGGFVWGISCAVAVNYSPPTYEYAMLFLIISLSAGSISTLSAIYRTYVAFNLPMISFLILSFILKTGELNLYIAAVLPIFTYVIMSASWEMHQSLKRSMELKDLYAKSQDELKEINTSLEQRIDKAVEENRLKDQQMLGQSRLAQMGEMLSMIAHQWRQPLSAITATTGSMSMHMQLDKCDESYLEEKLEKVNTYTQYLSTTINDFRDFFKPDKQKKNTSLEEIVKGSLQIIETSLNAEGIKVEAFLNSKDEIYSYPNEIKQVVLNLLKNSKDVYSEHKIKDSKIILKTYSDEDNVILEVCDIAGGIKLEDMPFIFDPYFTTKEQIDGTGLGLYMSKLIIEEHCGGKLWAKNEAGGACFSFSLPKA